jgi:hypothetical protein
MEASIVVNKSTDFQGGGKPRPYPRRHVNVYEAYNFQVLHQFFMHPDFAASRLYLARQPAADLHQHRCFLCRA